MRTHQRADHGGAHGRCHGGHSGIGLHAAQQLAAEGHRVYALCRNLERGQVAVERITDGALYPAQLAQIMTSYHLALHTAGKLGVACVRVPAVRLDADRVAALPWLLRMLYAPKNRMAASPERLGDTYTAIATRDTSWRDHTDEDRGGGDPLCGIYLDENLRPVKASAFAYDAAARERLWTVSQEAAGNPRWAW